MDALGPYLLKAGGHVEFSEDDEAKEVVQFDTLPTRKAIRNMLEQIEVHSRKLAAEKPVDLKGANNIVTHATDFTTQKRVGCFAP